MHAVRDGADSAIWKQYARYLTVPFGHPVHVITQMESHRCHVERAVATAERLHRFPLVRAQNALGQIGGKLIVTCGERRVSGEDAETFHQIGGVLPPLQR